MTYLDEHLCAVGMHGLGQASAPGNDRRVVERPVELSTARMDPSTFKEQQSRAVLGPFGVVKDEFVATVDPGKSGAMGFADDAVLDCGRSELDGLEQGVVHDPHHHLWQHAGAHRITAALRGSDGAVGLVGSFISLL